MSPTIQALTQIQVPPSEPVGNGIFDMWRTIEAKLGLAFPGDYKEFVNLYGAGRWANFFGVLSPFYEWKHPEQPDFFEWVSTRLSGLDEAHKEFPEFAPPFRKSDLFPIGYTDNGGTICWEVQGPPDSWNVVLFGGKLLSGFDRFDTCLTGFLVGLFEGKLRPKTFPSDFYPVPVPVFTPYTTQ